MRSMDREIIAIISGDVSDDKFEELRRCIRDKMKELGLDDPANGVIGKLMSTPKPLLRLCPDCNEVLPVRLVVRDAEVLEVPLAVTHGHVIAQQMESLTWVCGDWGLVSCRCSACGHVYCEVYPNTVEEFEKECQEYESL